MLARGGGSASSAFATATGLGFAGFFFTLGQRVELRDFGIFQVKRRGPRKARNPRAGEKVLVPEKCVVTFKPGLGMQQRVEALENKTQSAAEAADRPA